MSILSQLRNHLLCIPLFRKTHPSSFSTIDTLTPSATPATPGTPSFSSSRTGSDTPTLFSPSLPPVTGVGSAEVGMWKALSFTEPHESESGGQPRALHAGSVYHQWDDTARIESKTGTGTLTGSEQEWSETESETGSSLRGRTHLDNIPEEDENDDLIVLWEEGDDEPIVVEAGALGW